jgi:hypothetical protein
MNAEFWARNAWYNLDGPNGGPAHEPQGSFPERSTPRLTPLATQTNAKSGRMWAGRPRSQVLAIAAKKTAA